jgi:hypothetical protein
MWWFHTVNSKVVFSGFVLVIVYGLPPPSCNRCIRTGGKSSTVRDPDMQLYPEGETYSPSPTIKHVMYTPVEASICYIYIHGHTKSYM